MWLIKKYPRASRVSKIQHVCSKPMKMAAKQKERSIGLVDILWIVNRGLLSG